MAPTRSSHTYIHMHMRAQPQVSIRYAACSRKLRGLGLYVRISIGIYIHTYIHTYKHIYISPNLHKETSCLGMRMHACKMTESTCWRQVSSLFDNNPDGAPLHRARAGASWRQRPCGGRARLCRGFASMFVCVCMYQCMCASMFIACLEQR